MGPAYAHLLARQVRVGEAPEAFVAGAAGYTGPGSQASPRTSAFLIAATRRG